MFTESQHTEIRNYLLSKKLPIDILLEVNDHFVSQISDLQKEENLSFDEAFLRTKTKWNFEFILVRKNFFSSKKIPKIVYEINKTESLKNLRMSFYIVSFYIVLQLISAYFLTESFYIFVVNITFMFISFYPIRMLLLYIKQQKLIFENRRKNPMVNNFLHPLISFGIGFILDQLVNFPKNTKNLIYDFVNFGLDNKVDFTIFFSNIMLGFIILTFYVYAFISLEENVKKVKRINQLKI